MVFYLQHRLKIIFEDARVMLKDRMFSHKSSLGPISSTYSLDFKDDVLFTTLAQKIFEDARVMFKDRLLALASLAGI